MPKLAIVAPNPLAPFPTDERTNERGPDGPTPARPSGALMSGRWRADFRAPNSSHLQVGPVFRARVSVSPSGGEIRDREIQINE